LISALTEFSITSIQEDIIAAMIKIVQSVTAIGPTLVPCRVRFMIGVYDLLIKYQIITIWW